MSITLSQAKEKLEKAGIRADKLNAYASMNTRSIQNKAKVSSSMTDQEKEAAAKSGYSETTAKAKPGSMMAKANMVKEYNEKNNNRQ